MATEGLTVGTQIGPVPCDLDEASIREYITAVEDGSSTYGQMSVAPPLAVAALGVRTVLEGLSLPAGAMHLAQEHTSHRAVTQAERLRCTARVGHRSVRRDRMLLVMEFAVYDETGVAVLEGKSTLATPWNGV